MNVLSYIFAITISLALPVIATIWLAARKKGYLKLILLGALTFVVFQMLIRIPLLQLVFPQMPWYISMTYTQPMLAALFLGGSAALVEIGGRYLIMSFFMKDRHYVSDGIAFGIGHGGIEAILLVGVNMLVALLFFGGPGNTIMTFAAGIERLSAMIMQTAWSVMVLKSINNKKVGWFLLAFALHTLVDTSVGIVSLYNVPILVVEAVLGAFAIVMFIYILTEKKRSEIQ